VPLHCTVLPDEGLALVAGEGNVTRSDIKGCFTLFKGQPIDRYGKLINLIYATRPRKKRSHDRHAQPCSSRWCACHSSDIARQTGELKCIAARWWSWTPDR
jgi:hypothetical protein